MPPSYEPYNVNNAPLEQATPHALSTLSKLSALQMPLRPFLATLIILLAISLGAGYLLIFRTDLVNAWAGFDDSMIVIEAPTPRRATPAAVPDPTADWQTYRNEEYGFEFKYPENWFNVTGWIGNSLEVVGRISSVAESESEVSWAYSNIYMVETKSDVQSQNWIAGESGSNKTSVNGVVTLHLFATDTRDQVLLDQILSTFRFTN